ncbi:CD209 antigen-like protein A [Salvelinus namaycush]|uniref:CD209 antigen-like protein A n=1 Tax=Salvelinus namaycush TaxID=8040 RepID=A0A8U0U6J6_SALNM|nr:CD209 antigen-like protein A [Salvelinus namaycush]
MSKVIYAEPDMNKKVKFNRGEMEERIVDIYVSADTLRDGETSTKREETADTAPNNGPGDQQTECSTLTTILYFLATKKKNWEEREAVLVIKLQRGTGTGGLDSLIIVGRRTVLRYTIDKLTLVLMCPKGWKKFGSSSCYYLSAEKKPWEYAEQDCLGRGTHLVIINSDEEQKFLTALRTISWIGLTERETKGTWKWVDGTPLTTWYWAEKQPDNSGPNGEEDCAEMNCAYCDPVYTFNDVGCTDERNWICERVI